MTLTSFSVTLIRDLGTLIGDLGTLIRNLGALIQDLVTVIHNIGALISDLGTLICDLGALIRDVRNLIRDLNTLAKAPGAGADNTLLGSAIHWYRGGLLYTYLRQRRKVIKKRRKKNSRNSPSPDQDSWPRRRTSSGVSDVTILPENSVVVIIQGQ